MGRSPPILGLFPRPVNMPGKPRLDKTDRLLHRFYEPLVLLTILRPSAVTNRSSHTSTTSSSDAQGQLGIFLDSLSWICDYGLGGCTVSAVAAEDDPGGPIYWVAAPGSPEAKVRVHLYDIFELLRTAHGVSEEAIKDLEQQIAAKCINFSRKKVLHYHRKLKIGIARVQKHSLEGSQDLGKESLCDLARSMTELTNDRQGTHRRPPSYHRACRCQPVPIMLFFPSHQLTEHVNTKAQWAQWRFSMVGRPALYRSLGFVDKSSKASRQDGRSMAKIRRWLHCETAGPPCTSPIPRGRLPNDPRECAWKNAACWQ